MAWQWLSTVVPPLRNSHLGINLAVQPPLRSASQPALPVWKTAVIFSVHWFLFLSRVSWGKPASGPVCQNMFGNYSESDYQDGGLGVREEWETTRSASGVGAVKAVPITTVVEGVIHKLRKTWAVDASWNVDRLLFHESAERSYLLLLLLCLQSVRFGLSTLLLLRQCYMIK